MAGGVAQLAAPAVAVIEPYRYIDPRSKEIPMQFILRHDIEAILEKYNRLVADPALSHDQHKAQVGYAMEAILAKAKR
jgi:hypothetical protein